MTSKEMDERSILRLTEKAAALEKLLVDGHMEVAYAEGWLSKCEGDNSIPIKALGAWRIRVKKELWDE
jgi:hypothetical protein